MKQKCIWCESRKEEAEGGEEVEEQNANFTHFVIFFEIREIFLACPFPLGRGEEIQSRKIVFTLGLLLLLIRHNVVFSEFSSFAGHFRMYFS